MFLVFKKGNLLGCVTKNFSDFNDFGHGWIQSFKGIHQSFSLYFPLPWASKIFRRFTSYTGSRQLQTYILAAISTASMPEA